MKALLWIIGLILLLVVGVGIYLVMNSGALLERAMETYGSRYLGAPVTVGGVDVALTDGAVSVDALQVGNPAGFEGPPAFRLNNVSASLNAGETSGDLIVLNEVSIDGAEVAALLKGRESNLQQLMENLEAQMGETEEEPESESEIKLIIDRFSFTNARASVESDLLGGRELDIPDVHLEAVGRKGNGATVGEVLAQVLEPVYQAVTKKMIEQGIDLEGARDELEQNLKDRVSDQLGEDTTEKLGEGLDALRRSLGRGDDQ